MDFPPRLLTVPALMLLCGAGAISWSPAAETCDRSAERIEWSPPSLLAGVPVGTRLHDPALAVWRDTLWVAGNLWPIAADAPLARRPLAIHRVPGGAVPLPPGVFVFAHPRAVMDAGGRYHLFWLEAEQRPTHPPQWIHTTFTSLWHSARDGKGWSPPQRLLAAKRVAWGSDRSSVALGAANRIHLAVIATDQRGLTSVFHLKGTGTDWVRRRFAGTAVYGALTAAGDSLLLAYVGPDPAARSDRGSVFTSLSEDGGATWNAPVLVNRSGRTGATHLEAVRGSNGSTHLFWGENLSGGGFPEVVRHRASGDGGRTWAARPDASVAAVFMGFHPVADARGDVHAVLEEFTGTDARMSLVVWRRDSLSSQPVFPDLPTGVDAGFLAYGGSAWLVWSAREARRENATTRVARGRFCGTGVG